MFEPQRINRPALPAEFYRPEPAWVMLYFVYSFGLYFGGGYLGYVAATSTWPVALKVPAVAMLALLASNGLHVLGWLAHEGIHLSMVKNRTANMMLGAFAGSVLFFPSVGLGISHWPHHIFTNQARDPDTALQSRQQTFWSRLLWARIVANRQYMANAIAVLLQRPLDKTYRLPFSARALSLFSAASFGFMLLWLALYVGVGVYNPQYAICAFLLPYLLLIPTTGIRPYLEHGGLEAGEFRDARSYVSPFYTVLLFGNNYHLEHHLYPSVPGYKLPKVHKRLAAEGYYERFPAPIVRGVLAPLRYTSKRYRYPDSRQAVRGIEPALSRDGGTVANV
jgi:beta-carotene hydroxylase